MYDRLMKLGTVPGVMRSMRHKRKCAAAPRWRTARAYQVQSLKLQAHWVPVAHVNLQQTNISNEAGYQRACMLQAVWSRQSGAKATATEDGRQTAHLLQLQGSWGCLSLWNIRKIACQSPSNASPERELHVADAATMASTLKAICC